VILLVGKSSSI